MWNWTEGTDRGRRLLPAAAIACLLTVGVLGAAVAPAALAQEGQTTEVPELGAEVEERYAVSAGDEGILLRPRREVPGVDRIEVTPGQVAVNGEEVSPTILRSWFGDEAEVLLRLAELEADAARELLQVTAEPDAPADAPPGAPEDVEEPEAPGVPVDVEEPPAPRPPPDPTIRTGSVFQVGSDVLVESDEVATEVMAIGGTVRVEGRVLRDVVSIGGGVEVVGEVGNEVVAILGGVELGPESRVGNNVLSIGGPVVRAPGAEVGGDVTGIGASGVGGPKIDWEEWSRGGARSPFRVSYLSSAYWNLVGIVLLALLVCLSILAARRPVEGTARRFDNLGDVLISALVGLLGMVLLCILLPIIILLLVASVVGCLLVPLVLFLMPVFLVVALFGYAGAALRTGGWIAERFGWKPGSPYVTALLGVGCLEVWTLIGKTLSVLTGPVWFFAVIFLVFGFLVELVAWLAGFGGILLYFIEGRRGGGTPQAGTALPPASPAPRAGGPTTRGAEPAAEPQPPSRPAPPPEVPPGEAPPETGEDR